LFIANKGQLKTMQDTRRTGNNTKHSGLPWLKAFLVFNFNVEISPIENWGPFADMFPYVDLNSL